MTLSKKALLGGVAFAAMLATTQANAFNKVEWKWDLDFYENIYKNIKINVEFKDPTGLTLLQFGQLHIGDVEATAIMYDVENEQHKEYELVKTHIKLEGKTDPHDKLWVEGVAIDKDYKYGKKHIDILPVYGKTKGSLDVTVWGEIKVPATVALDATTQLPKIENLATAVGNNASIESSTMVEFHGGQFLFDVDDKHGPYSGPTVGGIETSNGGYGTDTNPFTEVAAALTLGAIFGVIEKSDVDAFALMADVKNGQLENAATAVGNNFSATIETDSATDKLLMGDLTQFAAADVTATAKMFDVSVDNYKNLGKIDGPLFSNVATAVGNNLSVKVGPLPTDE